MLDMGSTLVGLRSTVQTEICPAHHLQEIFHDIHNFRHLEENKDLYMAFVILCVAKSPAATHSVACGEEFGKDPGQKFDLTRRPNEFVVDHTARVDLIFYTLEQEGMLTNLPELHQLVTQTLYTGTFSTK
jgi:hypothetical protein